MKKTFAIIILILSCLGFATAQVTSPKKETVEEILTSSANQGSYSFTRAWSACNKDSAFFKSAKIKLYNHHNYKASSNCCNYVNWQFTDTGELLQNESYTCTEPTEETVDIEGKYRYRYKLQEKKGQLYLILSKHNKVESKYKVTTVDDIEFQSSRDKSKALTLLRVH